MADIFISYSKSDHALALKLSAFLESEGWTVWWDRSLGAADLYRDEIMKQLAAARAVITIWSPSSIKSDWVRAEAGRAKADGKLIPVKTPELTYADIPLPFGEMHTENVASSELIRAAIVAQLAKPAVPQSPGWQITKLFKYQVLTWVGIVGTAITVFGGLSAFFQLAEWARNLVAHWHDLTQIFWGWVFGWVGLKVPGQLVPVISFTLFAAMLVVGINLQVWTAKKSGELATTPPSAKRKVGIFFGGVLLSLVVWVAVGLFSLVVFALNDTNDNRNRIVDLVVLASTYAVQIAAPIGYLLYFIKERLWVVCASGLFLIMAGCLLIAPLLPEYGKPDSDFFTIEVFDVATAVLLQTCWMAVLLFSPLQQLTKRLAFVVIGVITLLVLSEVSKLNLRQYLQPPKVSDNSLPRAAQIKLMRCASSRLTGHRSISDDRVHNMGVGAQFPR